MEIMTNVAEKYIWYEDADDVSLPFNSCIIRLKDDHAFYNFDLIKHHVSKSKTDLLDYFTLATKIPDRSAYSMRLIVIVTVRDYETGDDMMYISHKGNLICNLGSFLFIAENNEQELNRLINRKKMPKTFGL